MSEPRSCPYCGGAAETDKYAKDMAYCVDGLSGADNDNKKCHNDAILSIVDWNTRPIEDRQAREVAELREECLVYAAEIKRLTDGINLYARRDNWDNTTFGLSWKDYWTLTQDGYNVADAILAGKSVSDADFFAQKGCK